MCGILFEITKEPGEDESVVHQSGKFLQALSELTHRGPDYVGDIVLNNISMGHTRLAIINPESGPQPINSNGFSLTINGEIYNYEKIQEKWGPFDEFGLPKKVASDCEVIPYLFSLNMDSPKCLFDLAKEKLQTLEGMFAFVLYHQDTGNFLVARDPLGIIPLYYAVKEGSWACASEVKPLITLGYQDIQEFPPGHYLISDGVPSHNSTTGNLVKWYHLPRTINDYSSDRDLIPELRNRLISSVKSHLMSDVPYAVLLSGGLDSSIICSIVRWLNPDQEIHTFSVGLPGSPDLIWAQKMAKHLNTIHHEILFQVDEALEVIPDVIKSIETYDTTTIRASTPMYLMARQISSMGFKMVLSGEGADELFGGYLYFKKAPNSTEFHEECLRKTENLHSYDLLRANKSMMAFGIEIRVPFLDTPFFNWAIQIDPRYKMCRDRIEKWVLRRAFSDLLHPEITDRQKEQFSDGVGYDWIDGIEDHANKLGLKGELVKSYETNLPRTDEERWYRKIYDQHFPNLSHLTPWGFSVACSTDQVKAWDQNFTSDPSGRYLDHHSASKL